MIETLEKLAYIDFTRIQFFKKPEAFESKKLTELLTKNFSKIPIFDVLESFCDELDILYSRKDTVVKDFNKKLLESQKIIKKLLLIKEHFERKIEVKNLQKKIEALTSEVQRTTTLVKQIFP